MREKIFIIVVLILSAGLLSGCAAFKKAQRADALELELGQLYKKIDRLENEKQSLMLTKEKESSDLEKAKEELERRLKKEIGEYKAKLEMTERGLVITFIDEIFFDSGKDKIRGEGEDILRKVANVLNVNVAGSPIAIEGHTDDQPIKYSGWKSNWELSAARALAVLHYLIDKCEIIPQRVSAAGYGEYRPVASNDTFEDRQKNRRVEIVILPSPISKERMQN
ncbi:MAG: flagellar motor protein MotB [Candidatus Omnitrophota bacterium]